MFLSIDPGNGLAIYDQVVRQIIFAIAGGAVKAGELVPSVRELARDLGSIPIPSLARIASCKVMAC